MDIKQLCYGCFQNREGKDLCPHCGYAVGSYPKEEHHCWPGTKLNDRYILGTTVGFGGFGIIYRAWDTQLDIQVAIKEFYPSGLVMRTPGRSEVVVYSGERRAQYQYGLDRFLLEARTMAKFGRHPNIVNVLDFFEANNTAYIVMEFLEGCTLKSFLHDSGEKVDIEIALHIITPVLEALTAVHKENIIHRDISPDNIFITSSNQIKLIDFGAARLARGESNETLSVILKQGYAPPEQYSSKSVQGPWTDIYALGATLYRMITGVVPEESVDRLADDTLKAPAVIHSSIPAYLSNVTMRAMALEYGLRFSSAKQMLAALNNKRVVDLPASEKKKRRMQRGLIAAASLLLVSGVTGYLLFAPKNVLDAANIRKGTEVVVWVQQKSEDDLENYQKIADEFMQTYPDIAVKIVGVDTATYEDELKGADGTEQMPDVFCAESLGDDLSACEDLSMLINAISPEEYLFLDRYSTLFPESNVMPVGFNALVLYTNSDAMRDKDGKVPEVAEEFVQNSQACISHSWSPYLNLLYDQKALGGTLSMEEWPDEGSYRILEDNEAFLAFASDASYMHFASGTENYRVIQEAMPGYYSVSEFPETGELVLLQNLWAVSDIAPRDEKRAGMLFVGFLLSDYAQNVLFVQNSGYMPLNKKVFELYMSITPELSFVQQGIGQAVVIGSDPEELLFPTE